MLTRHTPLKLGRVVVTAACLDALRVREDDPDPIVMACEIAPLIRRHAAHDWGSVSDPEANEHALLDGSRILSVYHVRGVKVWIITDAESDVCPACWTGAGICEPDLGEWVEGIHFRTDRPPQRVGTTVLLPSDY
jgi:hypothetical protein